MSLPGFTAHLVVGDRWPLPGASTRAAPPGLLRPAVGGPGFIGKALCEDNCLSQGNSPAVCRRRCSGTGGPGPGGGGGGGGVGQAACLASCEVVHAVCVADSFLFGLPACYAARDRCKAACRRNVVN